MDGALSKMDGNILEGFDFSANPLLCMPDDLMEMYLDNYNMDDLLSLESQDQLLAENSNIGVLHNTENPSAEELLQFNESDSSQDGGGNDLLSGIEETQYFLQTNLGCPFHQQNSSSCQPSSSPSQQDSPLSLRDSFDSGSPWTMDVHAKDEIVSEEELVGMKTKELNKLLRNVPEETATELKKRRRQLKNRTYAKVFRSKKVNQNLSLEEENEQLKKELEASRKEIGRLSALNEQLKIRLAAASELRS